MSAAHTFAEFNKAREWLLPAMLDDTEDEVLNDLLLNRAQLWRGDEGAMITRLELSPEPHVSLWKAGGRLGDVLSLGAGVAAWARAQGAVSARVSGRNGWARALRAYGFEPDGDHLRKAL